MEPYDGLRAEKVCVIGGGIAGSTTAYLLAESGCQVDLVEEDPQIMNGTSQRAIQAHLGGLYSQDLETATECLRSAIEFKKTLPFAVKNELATFAIASQSDVPTDAYLDFYDSLAEYYGSLPASDRVFGEPDEFYEVGKPSFMPFFKNIDAIIRSKEPALDMLRARATFSAELPRRGVNVIVNTVVKGVDQTDSGFVLETHNPKRGTTRHQGYDHVINTTGFKARALDHHLGDRSTYTLFLKTWNIVRNVTGYSVPSFYVVSGDFIHHAKLSGDQSSLIAAIPEGSYLDVVSLCDKKFDVPEEWDDILKKGQIPEKEARQTAIMDFANAHFLRDVVFEPVDMHAGVAVSYSSFRQNRVNRGVIEVVPGWQTFVPTKATSVVELARQAIANIAYPQTLTEPTSA